MPPTVFTPSSTNSYSDTDSYSDMNNNSDTKDNNYDGNIDIENMDVNTQEL